jgi:hypothetical protein
VLSFSTGKWGKVAQMVAGRCSHNIDDSGITSTELGSMGGSLSRIPNAITVMYREGLTIDLYAARKLAVLLPLPAGTS